MAAIAFVNEVKAAAEEQMAAKTKMQVRDA
jgi:hypothetical protein